MPEPATSTAPKPAAAATAPRAAAPAPKAPTAGPSEDERTPHGDSNVAAQIVGTQAAGQKAWLLLAFDAKAIVRKGDSGHVIGLFDGQFHVLKVTDNFAAVITHGPMPIDLLKGHKKAVIGTFDSPPPQSTQPIKARIVKRELSEGKMLVTIAAGYAQGVAPAMTGHVTGLPTSTFKVKEVLGDAICTAFLNERHEDVMEHRDVVIGPK